MRALRFESYGDPSVLTVQDLPMPAPAAGEVLIKVYAAGINPSDVKIVDGGLHSTLPRTPGRDFAGVVVSEGPAKGMEVWGSGPGLGMTRDGSHAEYLTLPLEWLSEKPSHLSMTQAASIGVPYLTAWSTIAAAQVQAGETVLVTGATGAVGTAAVQIAKWKGARVIGADRSNRPSEADASIDTSNTDLPAGVMDLTEGKGANVVIDTVGGPMFEPCLKSLANGGRQVAITSIINRRVEFDLLDFYHKRLHLIGVDSIQVTGPEIAQFLSELRPGFEQGFLKPREVNTWLLELAVDAYGAVAKGQLTAKQVFSFNE